MYQVLWLLFSAACLSWFCASIDCNFLMFSTAGNHQTRVRPMMLSVVKKQQVTCVKQSTLLQKKYLTKILNISVATNDFVKFRSLHYFCFWKSVIHSPKSGSYWTKPWLQAKSCRSSIQSFETLDICPFMGSYFHPHLLLTHFLDLKKKL